MAKHTPVIVVGMARSGTTLVAHILGSIQNVHIEVEPHALWKSGNYQYLNDEEYDITKKNTAYIRRKMLESAGQKYLVEKSPINSLRPRLVHAVFPEAKIVYIERDPIRCINSNYVRSLKQDSFKLSIILKKYLWFTGSKDLPGAISKRSIFDQLRPTDYYPFLRYVLKMFQYREIYKVLPFGPKLKNFTDIIKKNGLLAYHVQVYKASAEYKKQYEALYGNNLKTIQMEAIMQNKEEVKKLLDFSQIPYPSTYIDEVFETFDKRRITAANKESTTDGKIMRLLEKVNT